MLRVLLALTLLASTAIASPRDPAAATRAASEAEELAKAGKFSEAAEKFLAAWHLDNLEPRRFCNAGISYYKAKDLVRAHLLLSQCLEQSALEQKVIDQVRSVVTSVEAVLRASGHTPVRIVVDPAASTTSVIELGTAVTWVGSRVVWLPFGTYHLRSHAEGYLDATVAAEPSSSAALTVTIALVKPTTEAITVVAPRPEHLPVPVPEAVPVDEQRSIWLPSVATAVTVVAFGISAYAYSQAHSRADLGARALDGPTLQADRDAVTASNTTMAITGVVGIAGIAVSSYLWYRSSHVPAIEVQASGRGGGVSVVGRF